MTGRSKAKLAVAAFVAYAVVKEAISPSAWNTHDPNWQYPQIYTGTVPTELQVIRQQVAPGALPQYDEGHLTHTETPDDTAEADLQDD